MNLFTYVAPTLIAQESQLIRLRAKLEMVRSTRLQSLNRTYPLNLKGNLCRHQVSAPGSPPPLRGGSKKRQQQQAAMASASGQRSLITEAMGFDNSTYFGTLTGVPTGNGTMMMKFKGKRGHGSLSYVCRVQT